MNFNSVDKTDPDEEALRFLEHEEKAFKEHWVWKELQCTPAVFFNAVKQHVSRMGIPNDEWEKAYNQARLNSRIHSLEKNSSYRMINLKMIGSLKA